MRANRIAACAGMLLGLLAACSTTDPGASSAHPAHPATQADATMDDRDRSMAMLATARFQDVTAAMAAGYASSLGTLGCFEDPQRGGMGVHYINQSLMDDQVDAMHPEALVYELDSSAHITQLVAHEYIVPVEGWTQPAPPSLFGVPFHRHPTLPLWVLHAWIWKANPAGVFADWNPAVRQCPASVPTFGSGPPPPQTSESRVGGI